MQFWNEILTEKSWNVLKDLTKKEFNFILIGGWAIYLWSKAHKSKDIDIIVDFENLEKIKLNYELKKNDNLKKYEINIDEIDIDIYVPYYSKLTIPIEDIKNHTAKIENFKVTKPEILLILKQGAELDRKDSEKGLKDRIDILDLLFNYDINFKEYRLLLKKYKIQNFSKRLIYIIKNFKEFKYFDLNPRQFKLKKQEILKKILCYSATNGN